MGNVLPAASPANGRGNYRNHYRARQRPVSETQGSGFTPIPPRGEAVRVVASSYEQVPSGWELPVRLAGLSAKGASPRRQQLQARRGRRPLAGHRLRSVG